jgi:hypothetical protein
MQLSIYVARNSESQKFELIPVKWNFSENIIFNFSSNTRELHRYHHHPMEKGNCSFFREDSFEFQLLGLLLVILVVNFLRYFLLNVLFYFIALVNLAH